LFAFLLAEKKKNWRSKQNKSQFFFFYFNLFTEIFRISFVNDSLFEFWIFGNIVDRVVYLKTTNYI
jgi:cyclophilin family peptidyl-prolyl cis-trans isomerase